MIITIDGPTASGKSTVARLLAHNLHSYYLCSGMLFRGLAYVLLTHKKYTVETIGLPKLSDVDEVLDPLLFEYRYENEKEHIIFKKQDITAELKSSTIDQAASILSTNVHVRQRLLEYQRHITTQQSIVVDGRDTGSVVFPHADYKFFLTASLQERASRWQKDQEKRGSIFTLQQALQAVNERDERDTQRAFAPLIVPKNAIAIDSTNLSAEQVAAQILDRITV